MKVYNVVVSKNSLALKMEQNVFFLEIVLNFTTKLYSHKICEIL